MDTKLRQEIVAFLVQYGNLFDEKSRKALLLSAGLDEILPYIEISGNISNFITLLVNYLDQYGTIGNTPALVCLLQAFSQTIGENRRGIIQGFINRIWQETPEAPTSQRAEAADSRSITSKRDYFEHVAGNVIVNNYYETKK